MSQRRCSFSVKLNAGPRHSASLHSRPLRLIIPERSDEDALRREQASLPCTSTYNLPVTLGLHKTVAELFEAQVSQLSRLSFILRAEQSSTFRSPVPTSVNAPQRIPHHIFAHASSSLPRTRHAGRRQAQARLPQEKCTSNAGTRMSQPTGSRIRHRRIPWNTPNVLPAHSCHSTAEEAAIALAATAAPGSCSDGFN